MSTFTLSNKSRFIGAIVGSILLASAVFSVAIKPVQAQSMSFGQMIQLLINLGIIPQDKVAAAEAAISSTSVAAPTYTRTLAVGSRGADVTALQNQLGVSPATGYFGNITKAAVSTYQALNGLTVTGSVGSSTLAKLNGASTVSATTTPTVVQTPIVNTGVEGILTVNLASTPSSGQNVYEGGSQYALLGIKLQAQLSPIAIQRVQIDLGNSSQFYTKFFQTLYLVDENGKVLAQAALNSSTVTKQTSGSSNEYYITFSSFTYNLPGDNSVHVLTVKGDVYSSVDSTLDGHSVAVTVDANGVRGVDGAGVDQYGPVSGSVSNSVTIQQSLSDSAQLQLSTDAITPLTSAVIASSGSQNNEADNVTTLVFDLFAQKDTILLDNLTANVTKTGIGAAVPTTAYLYAGSNQISSSAVTNGVATFTNVNYTIGNTVSQPFTIKVDVKNADGNPATVVTTVTASGVSAENSQGNTVTPTGSATSNSLLVQKAGPVFTLVGSPTIVTQPSSLQGNYSTTTAISTFTVQVQALGGNVYFGTQGSSNTFGFSIYAGGSASGLSTSTYSGITSWSIPSTGVVTSGLPNSNVAFELQQNNQVQLPITFTFQNRKTDGSFIATNVYAVGLDNVVWSLDGSTNQTSNFMSGQTNWRTGSVSLP